MSDQQKQIAASRQQMHHILTNHFDLEELEQLAYLMGLDFDEISGATKSAKASNLIAYCERTGTIAQLVDKAQAERPLLSTVVWPTPWQLAPMPPPAGPKEPPFSKEPAPEPAPESAPVSAPEPAQQPSTAPATKSEAAFPFAWWHTMLIGVISPLFIGIYMGWESDPFSNFLFICGGLAGGAITSRAAKKFGLGTYRTVAGALLLGYVGAYAFFVPWDLVR